MASRDPGPDFLYASFPKGFMWGTSVAAGQVEGAWNEDGRGPSIWDVYAKSGAAPLSGEVPDVACDSYHKWQEDVELIKGLGLTHYRFSISWSRVLPDGTLKSINEAGIKWYDNFINALVAAGIQPMVTLYHNDLPQALQDKFGGMLSREVIPLFIDYARLMFQRFGDRVKWWSTFNEIHVWAGMAYGYYGTHAPGDLSHPDTYPYIATQNCLLCHAHAFDLYNKEFRATQKGFVGITLDSEWKEPLDPNNPEDVAAADREMQLTTGLIAHPIFSSEGDWPPVIKQLVAEKSKAQGLPSSRLPDFTAEEIKLLKGSADYYSLNQYSTGLFKHNKNALTGSPTYCYTNDSDAQQCAYDPSWPTSGANWLMGVPWGMRKVLRWIKKEYNNPRVIITENGFAEVNPAHTKDPERITWLRDYIDNVLKAIVEDGCNVFGYTVWSMMDNYEWAGGYGCRFGLVQVDFNDPNRKRTPKDSYYWYKQLIIDNGFEKGTKSAQF